MTQRTDVYLDSDQESTLIADTYGQHYLALQNSLYLAQMRTGWACPTWNGGGL